MKVITEEIKREIIDKKTSYMAVDGTKFTSEEACKKYEKTVEALLFSKIEKFKLADLNYNTVEWLDCGDDNNYKSLLPKTKEDIDVLNQIYYLSHAIDCNPKFTEDDINKIILMGYRFYYSNGEAESLEYAWFYNFNNIVETIVGNKFKLVGEWKYKENTDQV